MIMKRFPYAVLSATLLAFCMVSTALSAQEVAIKTNVLSLAALNANAGVEIGLAPRWTLDLTGDYNALSTRESKWKHLLFQPEARYWFCNRFAGPFIGIHALGGVYNIGNIDTDLHFCGADFSILKDHRAQGWTAGAGIAYGYTWVLSKHWNLEAEIGAGYLYTRYDLYECNDCGRRTEQDLHHHFIGPTKAAVNLVYVF